MAHLFALLNAQCRPILPQCRQPPGALIPVINYLQQIKLIGPVPEANLIIKGFELLTLAGDE